MYSIEFCLCVDRPQFVTPRIIGIPPRALRAGVDFPVGRGEEADAVRHARKKEQAGATGRDLT